MGAVFVRRSRRRAAAAAASAGPWGEENARDIFSYEMLLLQQMEEHSHMWQTPALGLTAQAFLLTISLDTSNTTSSRALAAALGAVVALLSVQLMIKHEFHLRLDRWQLRRLEDRLGIEPIVLRGWGYAEKDGSYTRPSITGPEGDLLGPQMTRLSKARSSRWWKHGLGGFVVVNVGLFLSLVAAPAWRLAEHAVGFISERL